MPEVSVEGAEAHAHALELLSAACLDLAAILRAGITIEIDADIEAFNEAGAALGQAILTMRNAMSALANQLPSS